MFNPLKLMQLQKEAEKIQKDLEKQEFTSSQGRITVKVSGSQKVITIQIDGQDVPELASAVNDAISQSQQAAAEKLQGISKQMGLG